MRKRAEAVGLVGLLAAMLMMAVGAVAAPAERYLHVKVEDHNGGESVNVNVPLSMAEKILPTVNKGNLHNGRVTVSHADFDDVDIRAILDAVRAAPDNEFVTIKKHDQNVRVAKQNGNLIVHVRDSGALGKEDHKVDVTVPMKVVDALLSTAKNDELDVAAALRALNEAGETLLVTVQDAEQHVRIWIDSKNNSE
jgi:hypothetical protein